MDTRDAGVHCLFSAYRFGSPFIGLLFLEPSVLLTVLVAFSCVLISLLSSKNAPHSLHLSAIYQSAQRTFLHSHTYLEVLIVPRNCTLLFDAWKPTTLRKASSGNYVTVTRSTSKVEEQNHWLPDFVWVKCARQNHLNRGSQGPSPFNKPNITFLHKYKAFLPARPTHSRVIAFVTSRQAGDDALYRHAVAEQIELRPERVNEWKCLSKRCACQQAEQDDFYGLAVACHHWLRPQIVTSRLHSTCL